MQLRTIVGAHAGEVREYTFIAAQDALRAGMAEPVTRPERPAAADRRPTPAPLTDSTGRRRASRRE